MKNKSILFLALAGVVAFTLAPRLQAQGTAFTYQGRLTSGGSPANGSYDVTFSLFGTNGAGIAIAGPVTNSAVAATNGFFITTIDFGAGVFTGSSSWLEIGVRTNGNGGFNTLTPRQQVTPTPYAITTENVAGAITVQNNTNGAPNIVGGSSVNYVASGVVGATIAGGGAMNYSGSQTNSVTANFGTVGGGLGNTAGGNEGATVSGGEFNTASLLDATIGGGHGNTAGGNYSTVSGGFGNTANGNAATVLGGQMNNASGLASTAAGVFANAINDFSFVWSSGSSFSSTADRQFSVFASGGVRLVGDVTTGNISLSENGTYRNLSMSGGNSTGYLYGAYPRWGDGIHLGYNYYADTSVNGHVPNIGGGTSRISAGYSEVILAVGGVNVSPNTVRLDATLSGVTVFGTFNNSSDRNVKQDFAPVSPARILDKVLRLPVSEWSYKEDAATRHIGPMGQDFYSAFNIGTDDKHIAPIDEGGIAFSAIQGLNQKVEEKEARIQEQESRLRHQAAEITDLKTRLEALEKIILNQKSN